MVAFTASLPARSQVVLADPIIYNYAPKELPLDNTTSLPGFLFDNNPKTYYASADQGVNTFVDFDFSSPIEITGFDMTQRNDIARVYTSALIFSNNPGFSSTISIVILNHTDARLGYNRYSFSKVTSRYVRWDVLQTNSNFYRSNGAAEMTFYGPDKLPVPAPAAFLAIPAFGASVSRIRRLRRQALQSTLV